VQFVPELVIFLGRPEQVAFYHSNVLALLFVQPLLGLGLLLAVVLLVGVLGAQLPRHLPVLLEAVLALPLAGVLVQHRRRLRPSAHLAQHFVHVLRK